MDIAIKVEDLSKRYKLGTIGKGTLSADINSWWAKVRGKEDPYSKIGMNTISPESTETLLALQDINFKVNKGEALGIIGKNGAGKSTLLKLLARITTPTTGQIKIKGRIAALLEVGTGFHPELTGRENIYLNGAILGMNKAEINSKLDEIIDFSGVERFIDTPVKRYSSGMRVRLAFAVAAHLDPEILIIDEVLAVGDAEFQKKCLGKMENVSQSQGRTVLFVSHNMNAINRLCTRSILLEKGRIAYMGSTAETVARYLDSNEDKAYLTHITYPNDNHKELQVKEVSLLTNENNIITAPVDVNDKFFLKIKYEIRNIINKLHLTFFIRNSAGDIVYFCDRTDVAENYLKIHPGTYTCTLQIPNPLLIPGKYFFTIGCANVDSGENDHKHDILNMEITGSKLLRENRQGYIFYPLAWDLEKVENE